MRGRKQSVDLIDIRAAGLAMKTVYAVCSPYFGVRMEKKKIDNWSPAGVDQGQFFGAEAVDGEGFLLEGPVRREACNLTRPVRTEAEPLLALGWEVSPSAWLGSWPWRCGGARAVQVRPGR